MEAKINQTLFGDCRESMRRLIAEGVKVQCVVCSPPYWGLRSYLDKDHPDKPNEMGLEKTPDEYIARMVEVFGLVRELLRDDGTLFLNIGDSYAGGGRAGANPEYMGKHKMFGKTGWNPGVFGLPQAVPVGLKPKDLVGIPWMLAFALRADGWYLRSEIIWHKPNPMPESVTDRPTKSHEQVFLLTKSGTSKYWTHRDKDGTRLRPHPDYRWQDDLLDMELDTDPPDWKTEKLASGQKRYRRFNLWEAHDYYYDGDAVREPHAPASIERAKHPANPRTHTRGAGIAEDRVLSLEWKPEEIRLSENGRNRRSVWTIPSAPYSGAHFACVDSDTECLTVSGWKRYDELKPTDTIAAYDMDSQFLTWTNMLGMASYRVNDGTMVKILGRCIDQVLTPNHRCLVRRRSGKEIFIRADQLKPSQKILVAGKWNIEPTAFPEQMARLIGWYVTEGSAGSDHVKLYQSGDANPIYCEEIRSILKSEGAEYSEYARTRLYRDRETTPITWRVSGAVANTLLSLCAGKRLPYDFLRWPDTTLLALWDSMMKGDGNFREGGRQAFVQKDKILIDQMQALATRLGFSTTLRKRSRNTWSLYKTDSETRLLHSETTGLISQITYTGIVWCPRTKFGTFVARRNGRVFITGNTYPPALVEPCILAGTSERGCCPACGAPWERVIEKRNPGHTGETESLYPAGTTANRLALLRQAARENGEEYANRSTTTGWRPTCSCRVYHLKPDLSEQERTTAINQLNAYRSAK